MRILWSLEEATVNDVVDRIEAPRLARNTVMTVLGVLEGKGYVAHKTTGRTFVYHSLVDRDAAQRRVVEDIMARFFDGSPKSLIMQLLGSGRVTQSDLDELREVLDDWEKRHD